MTLHDRRGAVNTGAWCWRSAANPYYALRYVLLLFWLFKSPDKADCESQINRNLTTGEVQKTVVASQAAMTIVDHCNTRKNPLVLVRSVLKSAKDTFDRLAQVVAAFVLAVVVLAFAAALAGG